MEKVSILPEKKLNIRDIRSYAMIFALIVIWILFYVLTEGTFLSPRNISNLARQMSITGVLATGMIVCLIAGSFDLSVGSTVAFTGTVAAIAQTYWGLNPIVSMFMALAVGVLVGMWQGYWIAVRRVPAFVVTLGGMMIFRGGTLIICNGSSIPIENDTFLAIGQAYLPKSIGYILAVIFIAIVIHYGITKRVEKSQYGFEVAPLYKDIFKSLLFVVLIAGFFTVMNIFEGLPTAVLILIACVILFSIILGKTKFGRYIYATGGNPNAARMSGINISAVYFKVFTINSIMAALAGLLLASRLASATPMAGNGFELDAIASCVIGGVSLSGGRGTVVGAIIGALVMASLNNGMSLLDVTSAYQYVIKGLIFIFAVWFDVIAKEKGN